MSILDVALLYGAESTYGTAATLTDGYEAQSDPWKRKVAYIESEGFRAGQQGVRRRVPVQLGAEGSIEMHVLNKSMNLLFRDLFGTTTGPTLVAGTTYDTVHQTSKDGPSTSATIQMLKPMVDGSTQPFTYAGCVCSGWELTQELDKALMLKADFDAQSESTAVGAGTPVYPSTPEDFHFLHMSASTVGATSIDFKKLSLKTDYKMNTDRRFLRASGLKKQPRVGSLPEVTGELEAEFFSTAEYTRFVNGTVMAGQFIWTGSLIESSRFYTLTLDLAAMQYTGDTPEVSLTELPKQSLPFTVLDNGTLPMVKLTVRNAESTL
jgi:Phage tail tube protein